MSCVPSCDARRALFSLCFFMSRSVRVIVDQAVPEVLGLYAGVGYSGASVDVCCALLRCTLYLVLMNQSVRVIHDQYVWKGFERCAKENRLRMGLGAAEVCLEQHRELSL